jgi:hypothetical protein
VRRYFLGLALTAGVAFGAENADFAPQLHRFIETYCIDCHDEETEKGDRNLEPLLEVKDFAKHLTGLEEVLDQLNLGEMPPKKKSVDQPTREETRSVIAVLTEYLSAHEDSKVSGSTVLRRLNRQEYRNTMRDLLGLGLGDAFDGTADFGDDQYSHDSDVVGDAQVLSDAQALQYLKTAERYLDHAFHFGSAKAPEEKLHDFTLMDLCGRTKELRGAVTWTVNHGDHIDLGHGHPQARAPISSRSFNRRGVPHDGYYLIKLRVAAIDRLTHPYDPKMVPLNREEKMKLGVWSASSAQLLGKTANAGRDLLEVLELPDNEARDFEVKAWLTKGSVPFVNWINGFSSKPVVRTISERYHESLLRPGDMTADLAAQGDERAIELLNRKQSDQVLSDVYRGPRVRLYSFGIAGPTYAEWPPASHQILFGTETDAAKVDVQTAMHRLAERAFRRPVAVEEIQHYVDFVGERRKLGDDPETALKLGMAALLSSPRFLYLDEGDPEAAESLDSHEFASRLSYFLWSSTPDELLIAEAANNALSEPELIRAQVERMLGDPRADAFVQRFSDNWLGLHRLGEMPPDVRAFKAYYRDRLEQAMLKETRLFFRHLLDNDLPVTHFLDSDYTFVNQALANHYRIPGVEGEGFQKVALKPEYRRGGLLGQASVLTVSANGVDTSPVIRGIWMLEKILGTPPSPPPPDVDPIEPDVRGSTSIREQLKKHRDVPACADCHAKIDPLGFALEFYDPIGGFRTKYGRRLKVDGAGQLVSGETFKDERELKQILLTRKDQFARNLASKLMVHASGREMTFRDQPEIDRIVEVVAMQGYGLRTLVREVAASPLLRKR